AALCTGRGAPDDDGDGAAVDCVVVVSWSTTGGGAWVANTFSPRRRLAAMGSVPGRRATITTTAMTPSTAAETRTPATARRSTRSRRGTAVRNGRSTRPHEMAPATRAKPMVTGAERANDQCRASTTAGQCHR